jgi:hypothetical protein
MNLQENIRRILREESSIQVKLKNMINKLGIKTASKTVGGMSRLINEKFGCKATNIIFI